MVGLDAGAEAADVAAIPSLSVVGVTATKACVIMIMVNKPFDVGDTVEISSGIKDKVNAVTIFSTVVETEDGLTMIIPNNTVWSCVIINHSTSSASNTGLAAEEMSAMKAS